MMPASSPSCTSWWKKSDEILRGDLLEGEADARGAGKVPVIPQHPHERVATDELGHLLDAREVAEPKLPPEELERHHVVEERTPEICPDLFQLGLRGQRRQGR